MNKESPFLNFLCGFATIILFFIMLPAIILWIFYTGLETLGKIVRKGENYE